MPCEKHLKVPLYPLFGELSPTLCHKYDEIIARLEFEGWGMDKAPKAFMAALTKVIDHNAKVARLLTFIHMLLYAEKPSVEGFQNVLKRFRDEMDTSLFEAIRMVGTCGVRFPYPADYTYKKLQLDAFYAQIHNRITEIFGHVCDCNGKFVADLI